MIRPIAIALMLWLIFIVPPATTVALLADLPFYTWWLASLFFIPLPLLLLLSVFRSKNSRLRWWVFQYLGVSAIGFSAATIGALLSLFISNMAAAWIVIALFLLFLIAAVFSAHRIHHVPLKIVSNKIMNPQRLIQISDVHIGSRQPAFLKKIVAMVNSQQPDMLLITGDLVDENVSAESLQPLSALDYPVFYSSGNHERYVDYQQVLKTVASQGVSILTDSATHHNGIQILGIEDRQHIAQAQQALNTLCESHNPSENKFRVLLYHQPDLWQTAAQHGIDLTLSGHTHNGQIWPFSWLVRTRYKHIAGHYSSALCHLFVSQGTGTWGPTLRFGTRCEMTVIDLLPE